MLYGERKKIRSKSQGLLFKLLFLIIFFKLSKNSLFLHVFTFLTIISKLFFIKIILFKGIKKGVKHILLLFNQIFLKKILNLLFHSCL